ncbi:MAG TPA: PP2C family serine/threonine-protein phosphatase [Pyrinomonadaceae bacterium]|jgi:protein phosphatase|nr:PP2C family serine/threonine-protein phosphatase [Pyrinomonadaceae bacterium]
MIVELHAKSDVGRVRRGNEDNFLVLELSKEQTWTATDVAAEPTNMGNFQLGEKGLVLVVSDGMGGALAGDVASRMAVDFVRDMILGKNSEICDPDATLVECLKTATVHANRAIHDKSQEDSRCAGMGATFTGAAVHGDLLDLVQVGDSRGYLLRKDQIRLATKDQSLVQQLVDVGQISEAEAETHMFRNVILQALGAQGDVTPVTGRIKLRRGDILLLCSDGLSGKLRSEDIQNIVSSNHDLAKACEELIAEANNRGGEDNITVILARFTGNELEEPSAEKITVELPLLEDDKTLDDTYDPDTEPR